MARPLRLEYEGAMYHITARGNERKKIFFMPDDYEKFKDYLKAAKQKYGIIIHSYVLMSNHYHLILETPDGNLSKVMHNINSSYSTYLNIRRKRSGHLFQGRYKAILVDKDNYLIELSRYIHLNPVRAGIVKQPEDYEYSSYRVFAAGKEDEIVDQNTILNMIADQMETGRNQYCKYVNSGISEEIKNPFEAVYGGLVMGGEIFIKEALRQLKDCNLEKDDISYRKELKSTCNIEEIIERTAKLLKVSIEDIKESKIPQYRKIAIYFAKKNTGATNKEIGSYFKGLSYSGVAKTNERFIKEMDGNKEIKAWITELEQNLSNVKG
ncbi:transposase [Pelotomaculum terephthalicicum JT]|uniref:REP-associated tyrosine transposase n=2 Tax=Pelotomaculum TaxID=191373 RepID=UPI001F0339F6|nr:transposase [Pelotomaculum terephthalicicum]MCG9968460.1 transposase [Pelotomaculum terephthalicicum JT]